LNADKEIDAALNTIKSTEAEKLEKKPAVSDSAK
jgi:hypothetical protein